MEFNQKSYTYLNGLTSGTTLLRKRKKSFSKNSSPMKFRIETPLEERLRTVLASTSSFTGNGYLPSDSPSTLKAEELVVNLIKGIHASDKKLIEDVINTPNLELIESTVRRLPVQSLSPLLRELTTRIRVKSDVRQYVRWLHVVLSTHLAYLASVPEIVQEVCTLHEMLESRTVVLQKVLRLQGRLGLILDQYADKAHPQNRLELSNKAAQAVFIEASEPEEEEFFDAETGQEEPPGALDVIEKDGDDELEFLDNHIEKDGQGEDDDIEIGPSDGDDFEISDSA